MVDELKKLQSEDTYTQMDFVEPEFKSFDMNSIIQTTEQKPKKTFGKRSQRRNTVEVKVPVVEEPVRPKKQITEEDIAPALYEVQPNIAQEIITPVEEVVEEIVEEPVVEEVAEEIVEEEPVVEEPVIEEEEIIVEVPVEQEEVIEQPVYETAEEEEEVDLDSDDVFFEKRKFLVSQYEDIEDYLEDQSAEGYHYIKNKGKKYYFRQSKPIPYYYNLVYYKFDPEKEEWDEWEKDGWKLMAQLPGKKRMEAGWFIFRNVLESGEYKKAIDNDNEKLKMFKKQGNSYRSTLFMLFIAMAVCGVTAFLQYKLHGFLETLIACAVIFVLAFILFIVYARHLWKIKRVVKRLKIRLRRKEKEEFIQSQNKPDYSETQEELDSDWENVE